MALQHTNCPSARIAWIFNRKTWKQAWPMTGRPTPWREKRLRLWGSPRGARWTRPHTGGGDYRPPPCPFSPFIFVKPSLPPTNPPDSGARSGRLRGNPASGRARKMAATSRLRDLGAFGLLFFKVLGFFLFINFAAAGQGWPVPGFPTRRFTIAHPGRKRKR